MDTTFKIGDTVRLTDKFPFGIDYAVSRVGPIVDTFPLYFKSPIGNDPTGYQVKIGLKDGGTHNFWALASELEAVPA